MGGNPYLLGVLPTSGTAYITQSMRAEVGIVISASHNPYQDNGIKIFSGNGFKLTDGQEETLEDLLLSNQLDNLVPPVREMGQAFRMEDANGRYIVFLKNTFPRDHHTTGDGIIAALQLIVAMIRTGKPLSELSRLMEIYPHELINVEVAKKPEIATLPRVVDAIQDVQNELGEDGRVLVRYSGTQNECRVLVERPSQELVERILHGDSRGGQAGVSMISFLFQ